jgi:hypothetical protein
MSDGPGKDSVPSMYMLWETRTPLITASQGRRVSGVAVVCVLTQAVRVCGEASLFLLTLSRKAASHNGDGTVGAGMGCASADWGEEASHIVGDDPCPRLHGRLQRRRVVGCVKCRFLRFLGFALARLCSS